MPCRICQRLFILTLLLFLLLLLQFLPLLLLLLLLMELPVCSPRIKLCMVTVRQVRLYSVSWHSPSSCYV